MQTLGVSRTLAVSSCKGGVGKSSIALRLALALRSKGLRIGLLDVDVHGPSLPALLPPLPPVSLEDRINGKIRPLRALGLQCMSWGFLPQERTHYRGSATVLRGGRVANVAVQLALGTQWNAYGPLDILVMDMPPGTGDVHISLLNSLPLSAAVVVSTPSALAMPDVTKGLEMLAHVGVPLVGLVENYAWHDAKVTKEDVCAALRHWQRLPNLSEDATACVVSTLAKLKNLPLPAVCTGRRVPFGNSTLPTIVDLARQSFPAAAGFQIPLMDEMSADALIAGGQESDRIFGELAAHVHEHLMQLPPISQQQNILMSGDPSIKEIQSWPRFLHRLKYSHYAG